LASREIADFLVSRSIYTSARKFSHHHFFVIILVIRHLITVIINFALWRDHKQTLADAMTDSLVLILGEVESFETVTLALEVHLWTSSVRAGGRSSPLSAAVIVLRTFDSTLESAAAEAAASPLLSLRKVCEGSLGHNVVTYFGGSLVSGESVGFVCLLEFIRLFLHHTTSCYYLSTIKIRTCARVTPLSCLPTY